MKRILLAFRPLAVIALVLFGIWAAASYIGAGRQEYLAFSEKREAWHARCDVYRNTPLKTSVEAQACNVELKALVAYAKEKGWQ